MFKTLINTYWKKFQKYVVRISIPGEKVQEKTFLEIYQERAERYNDGPISTYTPQELFESICDDIMLKIGDERYVLQHSLMREETYQLYRYYEMNLPIDQCPSFDIIDKEKGENYIVASIAPNMWRWWVEEMNY